MCSDCDKTEDTKKLFTYIPETMAILCDKCTEFNAQECASCDQLVFRDQSGCANCDVPVCSFCRTVEGLCQNCWLVGSADESDDTQNDKDDDDDDNVACTDEL